VSDIIFADGLIVKRRDKAPEFVVANLSFKVSEFISFLQEHESEGWVNVDIKISRGGKMYASLDQWKPTQGEAAKAGMEQAQNSLSQPEKKGDFDDFEDDIPF